MTPAVVLDDRQQSFFVAQQIDFIEQQEDGRPGLLRHFQRKFIFSTEPLGDIDDQQDEIAAFQGLAHLDHHLPAQGTVGLVDAGSIDEDDLRAPAFPLLGNVNDAQNPVAGSLGLRADDGEALTDQRVQQCRLARIRATQNAYEAGVEGHSRKNLVAAAEGDSDRVLKGPGLSRTEKIAK